MPLIWCSISGHGYGHAAQVVPVLNALGRRIPRLTALLRTTVSEAFFKGRLEIPWELSRAQQDVGCAQQTPLKIDVAATWAETLQFHADWNQRVQAESQTIRSASPSLVLSDISYLAIEAGAQTGIPTVGLCNLSWDIILSHLAAPGDPVQAQAIAHIRTSYQKAELHIRPRPGLSLTAFNKIVDVGPITRPMAPDRTALCQTVGASPDDCLVLVGFGGIAVKDLPFDQLERLTAYQFLVSGPVPPQYKRSRSVLDLSVPFGSVLASCDLLVTKPGYNMVVEAVAVEKPVLYVRRYNFADEQSLVDYLHRHGRGVELSAEDFASGRWLAALEQVRRLPAALERPPLPTGALEAAEQVEAYLR